MQPWFEHVLGRAHLVITQLNLHMNDAVYLDQGLDMEMVMDLCSITLQALKYLGTDPNLLA